MSVIQVEDLVSYQLRTNYLNTVKDGVGERLITINDGFLNTSGFKSAGWRSNPAYIKRVHSPPIPTAIASEYFQAPRLARGGVGLEDEAEEGGMVTGGGFTGDTMGPGAAIKRRRRIEQMEEEDSSDLSDESDDEGEQRAAQQIKFAKMPVRTRSGSSPARSSNKRDMTSPNRPANVRRGSQSAIESVKARARRDTITSSEFSSDNELDNAAAKRAQEFNKGVVKASKALARHTSDPNLVLKRQQSDPLEEEEDESDGSDASSAFPESIDSASILENIDNPMASSPIGHAIGGIPRQLSRASPKKPKAPLPALEALPPPRPISMIQPKSLLSAAIKARRTKAAMPFEGFASLSGKGHPNPLRIRIWVPFTTSPTKYYEVLMRRTVHHSEAGDHPVTVADLIGLSLWRYQEQNLEPPISPEKLNVNRWVLRLIDDDEVDYDFPALERTKTVVSFTTVNNSKGRIRAGSKNFDEFGLVEATEEQFKQNQEATPQFKQEAAAGNTGEDDLTPKNTPQLQPSAMTPLFAPPRHNPLLVTKGLRQNGSLADTPNTPLTHSAARNGMLKLIRVYINTIDAIPGQMVTVDATTDTYLAEVLDTVCFKRQLDKNNHVLKIPNSGTVVLLDRTVESIGNISDLELVRRRFATDGPLTMTGSPIPNQPGMSPRSAMLGEGLTRRAKKTPMLGAPHPLKEAIKQDEVGSANYKRFIVWRKQPMRFVSMNERAIVIDGEYLHIMPASTGKTMFEGQGKTTTVHFSNVVGCKVTRRHPTSFKVIVYKANEPKRYDFDAKSTGEAFEIVSEIKKGCAPYHDN